MADRKDQPVRVLDYSNQPPTGPVDGVEIRPLVAGRAVICRHCGGDEFAVARRRPADGLVNWLLLWQGLAGSEVDVYICRGCGGVQAFMSDQRMSAPVFPVGSFEPVECPRCNMVVRSEQVNCSQCGWSRAENLR